MTYHAADEVGSNMIMSVEFAQANGTWHASDAFLSLTRTRIRPLAPWALRREDDAVD